MYPIRSAVVVASMRPLVNSAGVGVVTCQNIFERQASEIGATAKIERRASEI